jgi:hypothetical protein
MRPASAAAVALCERRLRVGLQERGWRHREGKAAS